MKMVMSHDFPFSEIFDETSKTAVLTLPTYKEHGLNLGFDSSEIVEPVYRDKPPPLPFARSEIYHAEISKWRRLTAEDERCKAVYEMTFNVKDCNFAFKAGDTVGILPENRDEEVNTVLDHLSMTSQADQSYSLSLNSTLKAARIPAHIPIKSTLRHVLTHCIELRSVLKKLLILALSRHTKCDTERKTLEYLCSKEGSGSYTKHILNKGICILDIFKTFKTCKPPIEVLLANLPRLLPRPYSIVNSGLKDSSSVLKICFSVMDLECDRKGLTTGWLEETILKDPLVQVMENLNLESVSCEGLKIPMYLRSNMSQFSLPPSIETHILMIATGTGVAPFMGFLEERQMQKDSQSNMGEAWLFFGCRDPELDFLYQTELGEYEDSGVLKKLITAFSRVKPARRVQESLCDNGQDVARLINQGASVFVCGEVKVMVTQVKECIIANLVKHGGKSQEEAEKLISEMEKEKRYVVDLWS